MKLTLSVNGSSRIDDVEPRELLVNYLRDVCGLRGTNVGCDTSSCGACTVLLDGQSVKSCTVLAVQADGAEITTIEGISAGNQLHPLQAAFRARHALQCGYCTPGMIMAALSMLNEQSELDETSVRHGLEGNLCRCTGYLGIVEAILDVAKATGRDGRGEARDPGAA